MKAVRLSDDQMAEHAAAYKMHKAAASASETLAEVEKDLIIGEMKARKHRVVVVGGFRITLSSSRRSPVFELAKQLLGPRRIKNVIRDPQIDKKKWDAAVAAGAITATEAEACIAELPVAPHIYVNPVKEQAAA